MGAIQAFDIKSIREQNGLEVFVETGTFRGDAVQFALNSGFEKVISIEINPELAEESKTRFYGNRKVSIICGNSAEILKKVLPNTLCNVLFWLDAHFPGADARKARMDGEPDYDTRLPLEKELQAVAQHMGSYRDIVVCDDLWLYEDGNYGSGSFNDHCRKHGFGVTKEQVCGKNLDFLYQLFPVEKFTVERDYRHQGYILIGQKNHATHF